VNPHGILYEVVRKGSKLYIVRLRTDSYGFVSAQNAPSRTGKRTSRGSRPVLTLPIGGGDLFLFLGLFLSATRTLFDRFLDTHFMI